MISSVPIPEDFDPVENMKKIKELSKKLENFMPFSEMTELDGIEAKYDVIKGSCTGRYLYYEDEIAVQMVTVTEGTEFYAHSHPLEKEIMTVASGDLTLRTVEDTITLVKGDVLTLLPRLEHTGTSKNGCTVLCATIPASKDYPNGKRKKNRALLRV